MALHHLYFSGQKNPHLNPLSFQSCYLASFKKSACERVNFFLNNKSYLIQADIYLLKVSNRITRKRCEICLKSSIKTPGQRHDFVLVSLFLTLNIIHTLFQCFYCWLWTSVCWVRTTRLSGQKIQSSDNDK